MAMFARKDRIPIPPKDAQKFTTVCQYCNVGCGYYVYRWPVGKEGGLKPEENALGIDFTKQGVALSAREGLAHKQRKLLHKGWNQRTGSLFTHKAYQRKATLSYDKGW